MTDNRDPSRAALENLKERLADQPDINAGAPRPSRQSDEDPPGSTMDRPPPAVKNDQTVFDQASAGQHHEASTGTLPDDTNYSSLQSQRGVHTPEHSTGDRDIGQGSDRPKP